MYDLPTNINTTQGIFHYVATTGSGGVFGIMLPITIFFIILLTMFDKIDIKSISLSAFITSFFSLFLLMADIVNFSAMLVPLTVGVIGLIWSWLDARAKS